MIFVVNDPVVVEVPGLSTKRKPNIILISLKTLKSWLGETCEHYNFQDCVTHLAKNSIPEATRSWLDVIQFWELKATPALPAREKEINTVQYSKQDIISAGRTTSDLSGESSWFIYL